MTTRNEVVLRIRKKIRVFPFLDEGKPCYKAAVWLGPIQADATGDTEQDAVTALRGKLRTQGVLDGNARENRGAA